MADDRDFARGQRLLRELLPWARAESRKAYVKPEMTSALGRAAATYLSEDNLDALIIYPAPKGGWHADVVLKKTPPGIPNSFGTPVGQPRRTRAEAEQAGKDILVSLLFLAAKNAAAEAAPPVFMLHGWNITLSPDVLPIALTIMPAHKSGYGSKLQASAQVEQAIDRYFPNGFDGESLRALSQEEQTHFMIVLHIAALSGLHAYPMRQDAAPESNDAP